MNELVSRLADQAAVLGIQVIKSRGRLATIDPTGPRQGYLFIPATLTNAQARQVTDWLGRIESEVA